MSEKQLRTLIGTTLATGEKQAVDEIRARIWQPRPFTTLFFCSPSYDLRRLREALVEAFPGALHGCTSSGQIGPMGFQRGGMTAISIAGDELRATAYPIRPLGQVSTQAVAIGRAVREARSAARPGERAFGFLLVDGLSMSEERVASSLSLALGDVPLVGGSAGDDLAFDATHVFVDGQFRKDAALLLLFQTTLPFRTFKLQHFAPTGTRFVVTGAEPDRRVVTEINGEPAAEEYARLIGCPVAALTSEIFAQNPGMLRIAGDYYVRSIQKVSPDGSLTFFCAIEAGLVLHLGTGVDVIETLEAALARGPAPDLVLGCDCILRRVELEQRGLASQVGEVLAKNRVFGFSTYGEQYGGVHMNQTLTGVRIGGR